jgi:hypothetical protein
MSDYSFAEYEESLADPPAPRGFLERIQTYQPASARMSVKIARGADFASVTVFESHVAPCDVCGSPDYLAWDGVRESLYECLGCGAAESQYDYRSRDY